MSVENAVRQRRSIRSIRGDAIPLDDLSQLLWAAQGVTQPSEEPPEGFSWEWMGGLRTVPSAGALYPLELYVLVGAVDSLEPGLYHYLPNPHTLELVSREDLREPLWGAALRQTAIRDAPTILVFAGVVARTEAKYGERAERYVHIEVGAAAENVYLQAEPLGLGTVFMGAFVDGAVKEVLNLPGEQGVFGIMPVGRGGSG
jgi:SagB-type dehydrogenase family enzyme